MDERNDNGAMGVDPLDYQHEEPRNTGKTNRGVVFKTAKGREAAVLFQSLYVHRPVCFKGRQANNARTMTEIRIAKADDFAGLLALQSEVIHGLTDTYPPLQLAKWIEYIKRETADRYTKYNNLGYWDDGGLQGFVSWSVDGDHANIECLYVREPHQRRGVGSQLLQSAEDHLHDKTIHIRSTLNARPFYEKHGYVFQNTDVSRAGFSIACLRKIVATQ